MSALSRRQFVGGTLGGAVAVALGACRSGDDIGPDLGAARRGAGMEAVLTQHYRSTADLFREGRLGAAVPQVVVELVTTAARHHEAHRVAWEEMLSAARRPSGGLDVALVPALESAAGRVPDIPAALTLALRLEDYAIQTYLAMIPTLGDASTITLAGRILIVDAQHEAVLRYLLGFLPVGHGTGRESPDRYPADPRPSLVGG